MKILSDTWFTDGYIDFELKKYTLLAYLQEVNGLFDENKLYPQLADIIFHYNNLVAFRENKKYLQEQFPKKINGLQMERLQLLYEQIIHDDDLMNELEEIIQYSVRHMKQTITSGTEIYEFVEHQLKIFPVGIIPLDTNEGYFFLSEGSSHATRVYQYRLSFYEKHDEKFRSIRTSFVDAWPKNVYNTYEHIKTELIKAKKEILNPAVYTIETPLKFPLEETLLPVAKRSLVRFISSQAA